MILFSIFCGLLVGLCLLATIVEILSASDQPYNKVDTVENAGHISMDKDADEKTPLLSPDTTTSKVKQDKGKISKKEDIYIDICSKQFVERPCRKKFFDENIKHAR